jgi:hypothetical protein
MAMFTERLSLAMNQRGQLYKGQPLYQIVAKSGNQAAIEHFNRQMGEVPWAVYRVSRIYKPKNIYEGKGNRNAWLGTTQLRRPAC